VRRISIEGLFGGREPGCGTFEGEESTMDTSYGAEDILNRAYWLEMPPVELPLRGRPDSYGNSDIRLDG
jgi:hypothetical protein